MKKLIISVVVVSVLIIFLLITESTLPKKKEEKKENIVTITTKERGNIMNGITLNYHASIKIEKDGKIIYFDPYKITNDLNDADYIFITHSHYDHYSESDIKKVMNENTKFIITSDLESKVKMLGANNITVVIPNKRYVVGDIEFDTVPSYNINKTYHKREYNWVGYNVLIDDDYFFIVGDSDATEDIKKVKCDVIFVPVGGTYTMTDDEAAFLVNEIKPKYAVPIHYGEVGSIKNAEYFVNNLDSSIKGVILK